jgi:predicted ATPase/DNA-binding CsgD family transcriptional regulator
MKLEGQVHAVRQMTRLPSRLTPFVGRQSDLQKLAGLLCDPTVRLVTISGMGGVGKTSLAVEAAGRVKDDFEHGAAFVPLAQVSSVDELLPAVAQALGVQPPSGGDLQRAVLDQLSNLHLLLVLDNFENLLDEAVLVRDMLMAGPRLKVLVTSREKLNLEAELLYSLEGLELPSSEDLPEAPLSDSIALFLQRARQVRPTFSLDSASAAAVVALCRMVDGNALGILLAASGLEHFSPTEILEQATSSLDFLARRLRDVEARHSCLRALFESSFRRLDEGQKGVFRKLSVLRGGFDLAAAKAVAGASLDDLISLVEKSLLSRDLQSGRYDFHALLQEYAREALEAAGELEQTLTAHAAYYTSFFGDREARPVSNLQPAALDEIQADLDNIRQAWSTVIARRDFETACRMMPGFYAFCDMRTHYYDGEAMFRQAKEGLAPRPGELPNGAWAIALLSWYDMYHYVDTWESFVEIKAQALRCLEASAAVADAQGLAASQVLVGEVLAHEGEPVRAIECFQAAAQASPLLASTHWVDIRIGLTYEAARDYEAAIAAFQVCRRRSHETGEKVKEAWALINIGDCLVFQGKPREAQPYFEQARDLFSQVGTPDGVLTAIYGLSGVVSALQQPEQALELARQAQAIADQLHLPHWAPKMDALLRQLDPGAAAAPARRGAAGVEALSERELEVLRLLKSELSGPEIASRLVVSINTVRFHTKQIYQKLGANSRLEAIRRAKDLGL